MLSKTLLGALVGALILAVVAVAEPGPTHTFNGNVLNPGWTPQCPPGACAGTYNRARRDPMSHYFELRPGWKYSDGTPRAELYSIPKRPDGQPDYIEAGDEIWVGGSIDFSKVPPSTSDCWHILHQFKQRGAGSPFLSFEISGSGDRLRFKRNAPPAQDYWWAQAGSFRTGWFDFVYHAKVATSAADGWVELWVNGQRQTLTNGQTRMPAQLADPADPRSYPKIGYYRSSSCSSNGSVYHNGFRIGTSYAEVAPQ